MTASRDEIQKRQEESQTTQGQMMQQLKERTNRISQMENERNLTREINNDLYLQNKNLLDQGKSFTEVGGKFNFFIRQLQEYLHANKNLSYSSQYNMYIITSQS